jgi:hypothetical protein
VCTHVEGAAPNAAVVVAAAPKAGAANGAGDAAGCPKGLETVAAVAAVGVEEN